MKSLNKFILFIVFTILIISVPYSFSLKSYDITNDKKFTLSKATISTIKKLNNPVKIDVFLEGESLLPEVKGYIRSPFSKI